MNTIVTHMSPDLDAIASVWLIKSFYPQFNTATVVYVPAGKTFNNMPADQDPSIIHADTGLGRFDHHQNNEYTCASEKIFNYLKDQELLKTHQIEPLERLVEVITFFDHFGESKLPDADSDTYDFLIIGIIDGLKMLYQDDAKITALGCELLDGLLQTFTNKVFAEREIKHGLIFDSPWGKTLAIESDNEEAVRVAQKQGFDMVVRKSKKKGFVRVKLLPKITETLQRLYDELVKKDSKATWYYHASGHMVLNGSSKNPDAIPTVLSLADIVTVVKSLG